MIPAQAVRTMKAIYTRHERSNCSHTISEVKQISIADFGEELYQARYQREPILTTCGCFDILHVGHLRLFEFCADSCVVFIVGINSDESVRRQKKAPNRPIVPEDERAIMVAGFAAVDYAVIFDEDLPIKFLELVKPDLHIKGSEYDVDQLPERETVESNGGSCVSFDMVEGKSTSAIIEKINMDFLNRCETTEVRK